MKKKMYTSPVAQTLEMSIPQLMTGSNLVDNGDSGLDVIIGNPVPGDAGDAAAPLLDPLKLVWTLALLFVMSLTLGAQTVKEPADMPDDGKTHAMTLYLSNGQTVTYTLDQLDHVTYLPGIGMKVYLKDADSSVDYLFSQMSKVEYAEDANSNANWEAFSMTDFAEAWRLEYPHLNSNVSATGSETNCQVIVKSTQDYGITYSLEWDNQKIANRWTCYQLHEGNTLSTASRKDDFKQDPEVAVTATLADYSGSGFSRGHLCPSADRLCSEEQNKQTFFLTNMQPQYQSHNGGLWSRLETQVRDYATDDSKVGAHCDTLYIVKAATITDKVTIGSDEVDGIYAEKCNERLLVPKFFYMALLHYNKATDTYHALAFWTEHLSTTQPVANLGDYAISIDELERRTGIDFFCNLPDVIETAVEAQEPDLSFWKLTKSAP